MQAKFSLSCFDLEGDDVTHWSKELCLGARLQVVEKFLQIHAVDEEPGYFLGADYSIAETALTPFIRRYTAVMTYSPPPSCKAPFSFRAYSMSYLGS